jgi:hypothetical protein
VAILLVLAGHATAWKAYVMKVNPKHPAPGALAAARPGIPKHVNLHGKQRTAGAVFEAAAYDARETRQDGSSTRR